MLVRRSHAESGRSTAPNELSERAPPLDSGRTGGDQPHRRRASAMTGLLDRQFLDALGEQHVVDAAGAAPGSPRRPAGGVVELVGVHSALTRRVGRQQQDAVPTRIASSIEWVTNSSVKRSRPRAGAARPASCGGSARRAPRTARPSAALGLHRQRARNRDALLHAARERAGSVAQTATGRPCRCSQRALARPRARQLRARAAGTSRSRARSSRAAAGRTPGTRRCGRARAGDRPAVER